MKPVSSLVTSVLFLAGAFLLFVPGATGILSNTTSHLTQTAATFFVPSVTTVELQQTYAEAPDTREVSGGRKLKILIVPGHEPSWGGTEFRDITERDVVVDIADSLAAILKTDSHFEVMVSRTKTEWNPVLQNYFDRHGAEIEAFRASQRALMNSLIAQGSILPIVDQVYHNDALPEAVMHLYGTNKWASENNIDIAIHLHLNDYPGRKWNAVGKEKGFAIYVPEHQYSNAAPSLTLAKAIAGHLNVHHSTSTLLKERAGIIEDQELVAIGRYNTADYASVLIEYGYIYEAQIRDWRSRPFTVAEYSYQTYLGLQDFLTSP